MMFRICPEMLKWEKYDLSLSAGFLIVRDFWGHSVQLRNRLVFSFALRQKFFYFLSISKINCFGREVNMSLSKLSQRFNVPLPARGPNTEFLIKWLYIKMSIFFHLVTIIASLLHSTD